MKKQPVQNINRPSYPTLYQVNSRTGNVPIKKIAIVSALTASMALAGGCLEGNGATKSMKRLERAGAKYSEKIATEEILMGETETYIEGAAETAATTDDYMIMGDMVEPTDYELSGEETVETDCTASYVIDGDISVDG